MGKCNNDEFGGNNGLLAQELIPGKQTSKY